MRMRRDVRMRGDIMRMRRDVRMRGDIMRMQRVLLLCCFLASAFWTQSWAAPQISSAAEPGSAAKHESVGTYQSGGEYERGGVSGAFRMRRQLGGKYESGVKPERGGVSGALGRRRQLGVVNSRHSGRAFLIKNELGASLMKTGVARNGATASASGASDAAAAAPAPPARGTGFWSVKGTDFVDSAGNVVRFSGVIWSGFETPEAVLHGLDRRTYASYFDQMKSLGFNMLRLPFAGDTLLPSTYPNQGMLSANPDLQGLSSIQVMDKMIDACSQRGIKVILDYHRIHLTISNELGTWFDANTPESVWINNWVMLANRYKGNPTVIGADLFNEVHPGDGMPDGAPFWTKVQNGSNEKYNFRSATWRVMVSIRQVEPNWILFMEGMYNKYWWGGNIAELRKAPITFPKNKLAYSVHEYGPYVAEQSWFSDPNYPNNLIPLFSRRWGKVVEKGIAPVWVGEFGSFYPPADSPKNIEERLAFTTLISYIQKLNLSWTLAFWGPDSKDTGGILNDDWSSTNSEKLSLLRGIMHPNFV